MTLPASAAPIHRVTVIGAGTMGHGIAYAAALAGCPVTLTDSNPTSLELAWGKIDSLLAGGVKRNKLTSAEAGTVRGRLRTEPGLAAAVAEADIVIEAVVEDLEVKRQLFAAVDHAAPAAALLATNTSSLSVGKIATALKDPGRLVGLHFFNPVHIMRLVEVVTHAQTPAATVDRAVGFAQVLGKEPIVVKDSPGFASSRLGVVLGLEAMRMLEQGVATAEDIDKAMELGYNHPMGPLKLTDLVGLDVRLAIAEYLHKTLGAPQYAPPKILRDKVKKGELGKKTGKGFFTWSD
jgi:3-hydroxybutyryl-CoA dehydrogenase